MDEGAGGVGTGRRRRRRPAASARGGRSTRPGSRRRGPPERAAVARRARRCRSSPRRRTCATRSRGSWPACSALLRHRGRPAAVAGVHPARARSSSTAWRAGKGPHAWRRWSPPWPTRRSTSWARCPLETRLPAQGAPGADDGAQQPARLAVVRGLARGRAPRRRAPAARAADGRPRLSIVSTAHLSDEERLFVTALLLDKVKTWMRRQGGTTRAARPRLHGRDLRLLPAASREPAHQAAAAHPAQAGARPGRGRGAGHPEPRGPRLQGPGQHRAPGWWASCRRTRTASGCATACSAPAWRPRRWRRLLDATRKRVFLLHDVHRPGPCCCTRAGRCRTCAGRSRARRSRA